VPSSIPWTPQPGQQPLGLLEGGLVAVGRAVAPSQSAGFRQVARFQLCQPGQERVSCLSPPGALTLPLFGPPDALALCYPALFAFGDKPSLFAHVAQDTTLGHVLAETLEQAFL